MYPKGNPDVPSLRLRLTGPTVSMPVNVCVCVFVAYSHIAVYVCLDLCCCVHYLFIACYTDNNLYLNVHVCSVMFVVTALTHRVGTLKLFIKPHTNFLYCAYSNQTYTIIKLFVKKM